MLIPPCTTLVDSVQNGEQVALVKNAPHEVYTQQIVGLDWIFAQETQDLKK